MRKQGFALLQLSTKELVILYSRINLSNLICFVKLTFWALSFFFSHGTNEQPDIGIRVSPLLSFNLNEWRRWHGHGEAAYEGATGSRRLGLVT